MMLASKCFFICLLSVFVTVQSHAQMLRQNLSPIQVAEAFSTALAEQDEQSLLELWNPMNSLVIERMNPEEPLDASDPLAFRQLQLCALEQILSMEDPRAGSSFPIREVHACDVSAESTHDVHSVFLTLQQLNDVWSVVAVRSSTEAQRLASAENSKLTKRIALEQDPTDKVHVFMKRLIEKDYAGAAELSGALFASHLEEISRDGETSMAWGMLEDDGFFECIKQYKPTDLEVERSTSSPFEARAYVCEDVRTEFGDVFRLSLWFDENEKDWKIDGIAWW